MSSRSSKKNQLQQETTEQARPRTTSTSASDSVVSESYEDASKSSELIHAAKPIKSRVKFDEESDRDTQTNKILTDDEESDDSTENKSYLIQPKPEPKSCKWKCVCIIIIVLLLVCPFLTTNPDSPLTNHNWRENVDPNHTLSRNQQHIIRAALKPVLDKSYSSEQETVSTLLILSSNEEYARNVARCILNLVNTETSRGKISTEIDLRSYHGDKVRLDSNLKSLLIPGGAIRAVLLRHIDDISSNDAFEQLRLLFAYCDGENPVIPNRLIIMTATSKTQDERELRESFKTRWPNEHDFVDALMSRISGHTLFVEDGQKSIC